MIAFVRLLRFYRRLRTQLKEHNVVPKLFGIKGIVFLNTLQTFIFAILSSTSAVKPSPKLSFDDFYFGIPAILTCAEMVLFSLFNFYAYSVKPYTLASFGAGSESQPLDGGAHYHGGSLGTKALLAALNPTDIARGLVLAVRYLVSSPQPQAYGSLPLRQSGNVNVPPPYVPQDSSNSQYSQQSRDVRREHSPDSVEYGRVDRYTPLRR